MPHGTSLDNPVSLRARAADGTRTHDLFLTKEVLYQLSYSSLRVFPLQHSSELPRDAACCTSRVISCLLLSKLNSRAGEGNRTLVFSLEGCCSTIELHPHELRSAAKMKHGRVVISLQFATKATVRQWEVQDSNL